MHGQVHVLKAVAVVGFLELPAQLVGLTRAHTGERNAQGLASIMTKVTKGIFAIKSFQRLHSYLYKTLCQTARFQDVARRPAP